MLNVEYNLKDIAKNFSFFICVIDCHLALDFALNVLIQSFFFREILEFLIEINYHTACCFNVMETDKVKWNL